MAAAMGCQEPPTEPLAKTRLGAFIFSCAASAPVTAKLIKATDKQREKILRVIKQCISIINLLMIKVFKEIFIKRQHYRQSEQPDLS
jgi:hypothetical protein